MTESTIPEELNTETLLFRQVRDWLELHPGSLIEKDILEQKMSAHGVLQQDSLYICVGKFQVRITNPDILPALAAISLGQSTSRIADLLNHHGCTIDAISGGNLQSTIFWKQPDEASCYKPLTALRIAQELVHAFHLIPSQAPRMKSLADPASTNNYLMMALLNVDDPRLWPVTGIEEYFSALRAGKVNLPEPPSEMPISVFDLGLDSGYQHTDEQVRELMKRAGLLSVDACQENAMKNLFYRSVLKNPTNANTLAIIRAINTVQDEGERKIFAQKLIRSNQVVRSVQDHKDIAEWFSKIDADVYPDVVHSRLIRINLLESAAKQDLNPPFLALNKNRLFRELADEILDISPSDFGFHHFRCMSQFVTNWPESLVRPPENVNTLVYQVMQGLEHFLAKRLAGSQEVLRESAKRRTATFLYAVSKVAEPDYKILNQLNSESKALMAMNGYKIQKFSGMTLLAKGRVLTDDLGL
jgi:hypothetical protein